VHAAVIPTNVLPAPHGSTMMPDRARLDNPSENNLERDEGDFDEPVAKHLAQTRFLIRPDNSSRFKVDV